MMTQLPLPIPMDTPKGPAWAIAVIDYGPQWDLQWVTFVNATGECWTFLNSQIRAQENYTFGLPKPTHIQPTAVAPKQDHKIESGNPMRPQISNGNGHANGNGHLHKA